MTAAVKNSKDKALYFSVNKIPLSQLLKNKLPKGKTHCIIDETNGDILSFCSENYSLRKNQDVFKPFEEMLKKMDYVFNRSVTIIEKTKFYVDYIIRSRLKSPTVGDLLPRISIWNSYDGTKKTQISFGYYKLLCGNGLSRPFGCQHKKTSKHSTVELNTKEDIIPQFLNQVEEFLKSSSNDLKVFEKMNKKKATSSLVEELGKKIKISKQAIDLAQKQFKKEVQGNFAFVNENGELVTHKGSPLSLFTAYNALNYAIYHSNEKELPEFKVQRDEALLQEITKMCK